MISGVPPKLENKFNEALFAQTFRVPLVPATGGFTTVIVALAVVTHPHELVAVSVYVVLLVGHAVGFKILVADNPAVGVHE